MSMSVENRRQGAGGAQGTNRAPTQADDLERVASALLGGGLLLSGLRRRSLGGAVLAIAGGALLRHGVAGGASWRQALGLTEAGAPAAPVEVTSAITILKPAEELHRLWRDPQTLPRLAAGMAEVTVLGDSEVAWRLEGPLGMSLGWRTQLLEERTGELIRWATREDAALPHEGTLTFRPAPAGRGTEVLLRVRVSPPLGAPGRAVAERLAALPRGMEQKVLRRFKSLAETGEIPTHTPQPACRNAGRDE